jgi:AcrR family transcriptional regulator
MSRIANESRREYRSELRERQADETRRRILDATVRVLASGLASTSIPAIAREATVSVPTVYRHFGTKEDLFAALYPHMVYRAASVRPALPASLDEFQPRLRDQFARLDALGDLERAAMASPAAAEVRRSNMPYRIARTRELADAILPGDAPLDRERITRLLVILTGTGAYRTWNEDFGCSPEQAAEDVDWVVRTLIAGSARQDR